MAGDISIGTAALAFGILSQVETPALPEELKWAQLGALTMSLGLLYWLITRRMPAIEDKHAEVIKTVSQEHQLAIRQVCDVHRESVDKVCHELSETREAIEAGTLAQITLLKDHVLKKT